MVKSLLSMQETWFRFLGWEDPLEKEMTTCSIILAWEIPWTEVRGLLCGPWGRKELDMIEHTHLPFKQRWRWRRQSGKTNASKGR